MASGIASMPPLNLPRFDFDLRQKDGRLQIRDPQRRVWLVWTPEEWVRQHFCQYLVNQLGYPGGRISMERAVNFKGKSGRYDMLVYNAFGSSAMLIECKAPHVKINQAVLNQAVRYAGELQTRRVAITNGLKHFCFKVNDKADLELERQWPSADQL